MSPPARSEQYVTLRGPRCAPVLRQAVRWKMAPLGRDAVGQSWWTEPSCHGAEDTQYSLTHCTAWQRWQRSQSAPERQPLPPGTELSGGGYGEGRAQRCPRS